MFTCSVLVKSTCFGMTIRNFSLNLGFLMSLDGSVTQDMTGFGNNAAFIHLVRTK